jgi:hypothetical protein
MLELAVRLQHRVWVDREPRDDLLDRRQLVAVAEQAEPQGLAHLLDDLHVRRNAGARAEVELDHERSPYIDSFIAL